MTTKRSAAATTFSRMCAPPPPFTSQPVGSIWAAPSIARSRPPKLVKGRADAQPVLTRYLLSGRRGGHVDDVLHRPCGEDRQQPSIVEPVPRPTRIPLGDKLRRCFSAAAHVSRSIEPANSDYARGGRGA